MNVAVDIDGTVDSFPRLFQSLISALMAAGHHVYIITGVSETEVSDDDVAAKKGYLTALGITDYTLLVVVPRPHAKHKAAALDEHHIELLIDNKKANAKAAVDQCAVLLLWNSKE